MNAEVADSFGIAVPDHAEWKELQEYLGADFRPEWCDDPPARLAEEFSASGGKDSFYETSRLYLYDLAAFAASGLKTPLRGLVRLLAPRDASLTEFGCGAGSDGLSFLRAGYAVTFADFDSPSSRYLGWRLARRNVRAPFVDVGRQPLPRCDLSYAFDVLEHVEDPQRVLEELSEKANLVVVNFVTTPLAEAARFPMHRDHDWPRLLEWVRARHEILCEFRPTPTSWYHVVAFRTRGARPLSSLREGGARLLTRLPWKTRHRLLCALAPTLSTPDNHRGPGR